MLWTAQKADESFETLAVITLLHVAWSQARLAGKGGKGANRAWCKYLSHCVGASLGIWLIPAVFCEVHLFASAVAARHMLLANLPADANKLDGNKLAVDVDRASLCAGVGFAFWLVDFAGCGLLGHLYLHAYAWHPLTALALFLAGRVAAQITEATHAKKL